MSPRKVRLVADALRSCTVDVALLQLGKLPHAGAVSLMKVIASAVANAKAKQAAEAALRFKTIDVMGGPAMKRWRAVSKGQAHAYKKRMTHIRIVLTDEDNKLTK
ncbi:50S ribosomal protein L22 [Candidatus Gottesmanbacteria bacterium]|nr:50S ribosomal protein L22 [Candidatus Gottesmanbacteria bacterium]